MCFNPLPAVRDLNGNVYLLKQEYDKDFILSSGFEFLKLPCGKCLDCRLGYAREWSHRCVVESLSYLDNYFLTLTYDDRFLPVENEFTGEILTHATLRPSHIRLFMHDLRQYYKRKYNFDGIRFFVAGEYGDKTFRPHYHMLVFNLPLSDLCFYKKSGLGDLYFNSPLLDSIWKKGFVVVGRLTSQSASYTARYCLKKTKDLYFNEIYDDLGIVPEFTNCSRRPGIGYAWFEKNKDKLFKQGFIDVSDGDKSVRIFPTKYYKKLYKDVSPDAYKDWSEITKYRAETKKKMELFQTDLSEVEYLAQKERAITDRTKILFERSLL